MAQPNLAREPSMEEILASIRRIIETNEPVGDGSFSRPQPDAYDDEVDEEQDAGFAPEMVANDRGQPQQQPHPLRDYPVETPAPAAASVAERSLSLADVAARVRAASVRQQEALVGRPPAPAPVAAPMADAAPVAAPMSPSFDHVELRASIPLAEMQPAPEPRSFEPTRSEPASLEPRNLEARVFEPGNFESSNFEPAERPRPAPRFEALAQEPQPVESEPASLPARIEETARLLSAEAGAQVAQSFNDLAAVFNGLERRSVEDMAQEMLRPMLQEWLDDNLPTLVERLVREEIERVARGPRR